MATVSEGSARLEQLIARTALKDQAAFKQLYDLTVRTLLAITVRLLREQAWAEEVLQEAYVSIWNSAGNYSSAKAAPMTWLMTIARNRAMDALRSTTSERATIVRPVVSDDEESSLPDIADESAGPLERLMQNIDAKQLKGCLQTLEPSQRQAVALAFYDGLTHSELAVHMREPLGTVKAWVRRGLEKLKKCLEVFGTPA
ncbi:MAG: sigma-70 family RNA polymerase sigma factor [Burkholderiales bacterium]